MTAPRPVRATEPPEAVQISAFPDLCPDTPLDELPELDHPTTDPRTSP